MQIFKKNEKSFDSMDKQEKSQFLKNDFIERMIRVEQRVSASFGRPLLYNQTHYYKSLTALQKKNFEGYIKTKKGKTKFLLSFLGLIFFSSLITARLTGNVINENFLFGLEVLQTISLGLIFIVLIVLLIVSISKKKKEQRLTEVINLFDKSIKKRK